MGLANFRSGLGALMYNYTEAFREATAYSLDKLDGPFTHRFLIDQRWTMSIRPGLKAASSELQRYFTSGQHLDANCFLATAILSRQFIHAGIPHAITVGDVAWQDGNNYVNATRESLMVDIERGFDPRLEEGAPVLDKINAHCWITLPNAEVVDVTIISARDQIDDCISRDGSGLLPWIYRKQNNDLRIARHIPILVGLDFHMKVATGVNHTLRIQDEFLPFYEHWAGEYLAFLKRA
jgi:hypothetical protein